MKQYTFIKNVGGMLSIKLESYNFQTPSRKFIFQASVEKIIIPEIYALGLYVTDAAMRQKEIGCFYIENEDELKKAAEELGFYNGAYHDITKKEDIVKMLKGNKVDEIKSLIDKGNPIDINNLLASARDLEDSLTTRTKDVISKELNVVLDVADE